jgi:DNA-binding NarL/FixJ family response regulator
MQWFWRRKFVAPVASPPSILLVDDEQSAHVEVATALHDLPWPLLSAFNVSQATEILEHETKLAASLVDINLGGPNGDEGLQIIALARARFPSAPCAALSGGLRANHINEVTRLRADFISKFEVYANVREYTRRIVVAGATENETVRRIVEQYSLEHKMSARETEILAFAAAGVPRRSLPEKMSLGGATVKTHVRSLVKKLGFRRYEELAAYLRDLAFNARSR